MSDMSGIEGNDRQMAGPLALTATCDDANPGRWPGLDKLLALWAENR